MVPCFLWPLHQLRICRIISCGKYAIKGVFVCDDTVKITLVEMGWPYVHGNQFWSNSDVYLSKEKYFRNKEILLGDLAFSAYMFMVPAFKKGPNATLSKEPKYFNTKLVKVRIKNEHCIVPLKAGSKCDLALTLQMLMCACILQNLLD